MAWFCQHDDFRFFFFLSPQTMATLGHLFQKHSLWMRTAILFFTKWPKLMPKKRKNHPNWEYLWSQNVNTLDNHSLYLFIYLDIWEINHRLENAKFTKNNMKIMDETHFVIYREVNNSKTQGWRIFFSFHFFGIKIFAKFNSKI